MNLSWDDLLKSALSVLFGSGMVGGLWAYVRSRPKGQADISTAQAAYQSALNEQTRAFTTSLMELTGEQRDTINRLEQRVLDLEDDNRRCHNENRNLRAMLGALMRQLRAAGIDLPPDLQVAAILETETADGGLTAFTGIARKVKP